MARGRQRQRSRGTNKWREVAAYLWATAEDLEDEVLALTAAKLASQEALHHRSRKYGPRGPYNTRRSMVFFDLLLYDHSEKIFKEWFR